MCTLSSVLLSSTQTVTSNGPLTLLLKNLKSHCTATLFSQSKRAFFHRSLPLSFRLFITPALSHNSGLIATAQWRSTMAGRFFAESVNLGVCVQPMRVSLCVWSQAGPGNTQWLTIDGETITVLFLASTYMLYHSPHTPSIHLAKYWWRLAVFCKHCSVAAGMLINRKRQRCTEWDSIWNMSNGVSSRPGRLVTGTSEQSRFWTTSNEHWGNEYEFLHPSQYLAALYVRGVQRGHYL